MYFFVGFVFLFRRSGEYGRMVWYIWWCLGKKWYVVQLGGIRWK